jgi:flagellar basal-body rod modification protein FlgD
MSDAIWSLMARATMAAATAAAAASTETSRTTSGTHELGLGRDAFMKLLIAQMQGQDPLSPMDGQEFFAQLAQLSVLEQMWQMNDKLQTMTQQQQLLQAGALIGKTVEATDPQRGLVSGVVAGVRVREGQVFLDLGYVEVSLNQVNTVR